MPKDRTLKIPCKHPKTDGKPCTYRAKKVHDGMPVCITHFGVLMRRQRHEEWLKRHAVEQQRRIDNGSFVTVISLVKDVPR